MESTAPATADLIVMGGGIAGLCAAVRAGELGRRAIVLEKGEAPAYACNSRFSAGIVHVANRDPTLPAAVLRDAIDAATGGTAQAALADAVAGNAGRLIAWLRAQGVGFARGGPEEYKRWVMTPLRPSKRGNIWQGIGPDVMLRSLAAKLDTFGGRILRGARVTEVARDGGRWIVRTDDASRFAAPSLVIADGGFQASPADVARHISPRPGHLLQRGAATGCGDGMRIATALGAATVGLGRFYGHVMSAQALEMPELWPYPLIDPIAAAGIVVNAEATRFVDEAEGGVFIANAIARLDQPLSSWVVFDEAIWNGPGVGKVVPPNPNLMLGGAVMYRANSIAALAAAIELPADTLAETIRAHNAALAGGPACAPPRGRAPHAPLPIRTPPFRALQLAAGITYTMGGLAIDAHARVLDGDGSVIPGLYAAGAATGGLEGGARGGYVGGLAKSAITGLLAAECIASGPIQSGTSARLDRPIKTS